MTIAYWCVLIVIFMPIVWVFIARLPTFTLERNLVPRPTADQLTGYQQRLYWAHLNALEVVAPFSALVIIAHQLHGVQSTIDMLAVSFVGLRIAHAFAYAANLGVLRSLMFIAAWLCMVMILITAI
jgi:uncharacterized MAPEG superfamily protein